MSEIETTQTATETAPLETKLIAIPGGRPDADVMVRGMAERAMALGQPTRLRLEADVFLPGAGEQYRSWPGVKWKAEFADVEELIRFRDELAAFIENWFVGPRE